MEIILNKDIDKLGKEGSIVKVKDGFARNHLFPKGLALPLNANNLKKVEQIKRKKAQEYEKTKKDAEALRNKLSALSVTIPVLTQEEEKLYGSITSQDISQALADEGFEIDKNMISLDEPIKVLGVYEAKVKLHPEVSAQIKIWVVKK